MNEENKTDYSHETPMERFDRLQCKSGKIGWSGTQEEFVWLLKFYEHEIDKERQVKTTNTVNFCAIIMSIVIMVIIIYIVSSQL